MPPLPPRPCRWPGCPKLSSDGSGYCPDHVDQAKARQAKQRHEQDRRQSAARRGYDRRWAAVRAIKLRTGPLCERCGKVATVVHHVVPVEDRPDLRLDLANLESLCRSCHEIEHGRRKK